MPDKYDRLSDGTTAFETFTVILPSFFFSLITCVLTSTVMNTRGNLHSTWRLILEFLLIVVPIILNVTVLAGHVRTILISLFIVTTTLCIMSLKSKGNVQNRPRKKVDTTKCDFITLSRSTINLISVIGILAVDFMIFPRRFAKTIKCGYSLMDVGVGLFVFSNGIVAPEIRGHKNSIIKSIKSVIPLIVLGGARFMITKETDYHVPVTEYGVHWNFFITLAVVKIMSSVILNFISVKNAIFSGISLLLVHEIILQLGLTKFVLSNAKRDSFLKANREGIVSSTGYVSLYFLSVEFGKYLKTRKVSKWKFFLQLCIMSGFLLWATLILEKNFNVSRRLANSGYVMWIMFIGVAMTTLFYLAELIQEYIYEARVTVPIIFEAVNYNGLAFFLLANLLTGLVNIMFDTLKVGDYWSLIILIIYMLVNCGASYLLYIKQIKVKL